MELKVVIKRRKPGAPSESEARRQRLQANKLSVEERYIEELIDARESGRVDPFTSGSPQVARWYAKQYGMMLWIAGTVCGEGPIQHLVGRQQLHGFFQLYSLEQMEARLIQIMKTIKVDRLFICRANQPPSAGIMYMRGYGIQGTVTGVSWALNRAGHLIPHVMVGTKRLLGHNARFILDNGIGVGAQVRFSGTTIDVVLASEEPALPEIGTWTLVGSHAEPVAGNSIITALSKQLKEAGIKGLTTAHIKKMVKAGITTISDIASIDLVPVLGAKVGLKLQSRLCT